MYRVVFSVRWTYWINFSGRYETTHMQNTVHFIIGINSKVNVIQYPLEYRKQTGGRTSKAGRCIVSNFHFSVFPMRDFRRDSCFQGVRGWAAAVTQTVYSRCCTYPQALMKNSLSIKKPATINPIHLFYYDVSSNFNTALRMLNSTSFCRLEIRRTMRKERRWSVH